MLNKRLLQFGCKKRFVVAHHRKGQGLRGWRVIERPALLSDNRAGLITGLLFIIKLTILFAVVATDEMDFMCDIMRLWNQAGVGRDSLVTKVLLLWGLHGHVSVDVDDFKVWHGGAPSLMH
ncbi:hypothetical protein [Pseudomonas amygdali]|uniref:Uncharacterized protein n=1 Tax=Pseudomonas amygdali pv. lachrymans str. M301315 TaxID=629260 RepID=A0AAD0V9N5_PSEAV|nr:hypothetical protein [Pseudomonas amygdali]AXH59916.1 hypothetical protein PLA107_032340 [Pseudomonas amygdali pv. lachrymans str. M301315]